MDLRIMDQMWLVHKYWAERSQTVELKEYKQHCRLVHSNTVLEEYFQVLYITVSYMQTINQTWPVDRTGRENAEFVRHRQKCYLTTP